MESKNPVTEETFAAFGSPATSDWELILASDESDENRDDRQADNELGTAPSEVLSEDAFEKLVLGERKPKIESISNCVVHQGHLIHLAMEENNPQPIVVPASYVNRNFPQVRQSSSGISEHLRFQMPIETI